MRQNKFLATKDHFIMIASSNESGDELWAGHAENKRDGFNPTTTNAIGFLVRGSVNSFVKTSEDSENWSHYRSAEAPLMLIKNNFIDFGLVSASNSTSFGSILTRESVFNSHNALLLHDAVNDYERHQIHTQNNSMSVVKKCKTYSKRDINTFAGISQEPLDINVIPDSEIQIEVAEE